MIALGKIGLSAFIVVIMSCASASAFDDRREDLGLYFTPYLASGLGLFERNPAVIYSAPQPRTCRLNINCPADVNDVINAALGR